VIKIRKFSVSEFNEKRKSIVRLAQAVKINPTQIGKMRFLAIIGNRKGNKSYKNCNLVGVSRYI